MMVNISRIMIKRTMLVVCLLTSALLLRAQDTVTDNGYTIFRYPSGVKSSEGYLVNGQPDGWWKSYDEKGRLVSEGNRKNLLLDSIWTFYTDGKRSMTIHYLEGQKHGEQIQFSPREYTVSQWQHDTIVGAVRTFDTAGWLKKMVPYFDGKPHGMAKEFDDTGLVVAVTNYYHGVMSRRERINRTDKFGMKQGGWKYFWNNGQLRVEGNYLNGKKHGFFKFYDEGGNFLYVEKYEHDQLITDAKETKQLEKRMAYHSNGQPSIVATYYNGKPDGIRREFDPQGKITKGYVFEEGWMRFEGVTDMNGLRQGLWKEYYPTGELRSMGKYKNSKPIGEWNFYFEDKTVEITGEYDNKGEKQGEWIWFYPDGDTMTIAHYEDGDADGEYVEYDEDGKTLVKGTYVAGYEEGPWYYRNGEAVGQGNYEGGKQTGLWKTHYENGGPAFEIRYRDGIRDGKYTAYWENGNIKVTGKYEKGQQDGPWNYYNEDGVLFLTTLFSDGKEIKWNNYTIK